MTFKLWARIIPGLFLLSSCASILKGTTDTIYVKSTVPGTRLFLDKVDLGLNEGSIKISKKKLKRATLYAVKDGCEIGEAKIETQFDYTTLLGLPLDLGIVSILIVDWGIYGSTRQAVKLTQTVNPICH